MKKTLIFLCIMIFATTLSVFSGCQKNETKSCSKEGCSAKVTGANDDLVYCSQHKCIVSGCEYPNIGCIENITSEMYKNVESYLYCRKCLYEKTTNKKYPLGFVPDIT